MCGEWRFSKGNCLAQLSGAADVWWVDCPEFSLKCSFMTSYCSALSLLVMWQIWRSHHSIHHCRKPSTIRVLHGSVFYRSVFSANKSFTLRHREIRVFLVRKNVELLISFSLEPQNWCKWCRNTFSVPVIDCSSFMLPELHGVKVLLYSKSVGVVTSGHVTNMTVTLFDPPWPKTPAIRNCTALSFIELELFCRLKFYTAEIGNFPYFCEK